MERPESSDTVVEVHKKHDTVLLVEPHSQECARGETEQVLHANKGVHYVKDKEEVVQVSGVEYAGNCKPEAEKWNPDPVAVDVTFRFVKRWRQFSRRPEQMSITRGLESDTLTQCGMVGDPMSEGCNYFKIELTQPPEDGDGIGVLLKTDQMPYKPGWQCGSIGYHAKDGGLYNQFPTTEIYTATCKEGDSMGCGIDYTTAKDGYIFVWFTKNGQLVSYPQKLEFPPLSKPLFHPLIRCNTHTRAVNYTKPFQKTLEDKTCQAIMPWWEVAGFESPDDMPTVPVTSNQSNLQAEVENGEMLQALVVVSKTFKIFDELWEDLSFGCDTFAEWLKKAEKRIKKKCWNLEADPVKKNAIAKCLATKVLEEVTDKDSAIPLFLASPAQKSLFLEVSVVSGLLNLGCPAKVFLDKYYHCISPPCLKLLLNSGANPNVVDSDGNTALHIFQNDITKMKRLLEADAVVTVQNHTGDTPLHLAAKAGQIALAEILLSCGASSSMTNNANMSPLDIAAAAGHSECFKSMFTLATKPQSKCSDRMKWTEASQKWKEAYEGLKSNLRAVRHDKIQEMTREEVYYAAVHTSDSTGQPDLRDKPDKQSVQRMLSLAEARKIDLKPEALETILNCCLYGGKLVVTDILEANLEGELPLDNLRSSTFKPQHDSTILEEGNEADATDSVEETDFGKSMKNQEAHLKAVSLLSYLGKRPKLFYKLASHPTLKTFIHFQWNQKACKWFWLCFFLYLLKMVFLTLALAIAARPELTDDQLNKYPQLLDYFRGICEVLLLIFITINIIVEILEFTQSGWSTYLQDRLNYFQWFSMCLPLLIIPFRATDHHGQWIVASLAYLCNGLRAFQHASLLKLTGPYVHALLIIVARDILRFMVVFMITLATFSGAFYLSLRYDDSVIISASSNTTSPGGGVNSDQRGLDGEGQLLHEVYFTGLRVLIETRSALSYYGANGSLRFLSVVLYLMFLFMIIILLLNTLIAQVSDTYTKVLSTAERVHLYYQCAYIAKVERRKIQSIILCLKRLCCCASDTFHDRKFPNSIWIGKKPKRRRSKRSKFLRALKNLFTVRGYGEGDDFTLAKMVEEETEKVERKVEEGVKKLSAAHEKMEEKVEQLAQQLGVNAGDETTVANMVKEETDKVEQIIEVEVNKLTKQLKDVCAVHANSERKMEEMVTKLVEQLVSKEEEVKKLQEQLVCKEEEVKKQLQEMMSLLRKEPEHALETK